MGSIGSQEVLVIVGILLLCGVVLLGGGAVVFFLARGRSSREQAQAAVSPGTRFCSACGAENPKENTFCEMCGAAMDSAG